MKITGAALMAALACTTVQDVNAAVVVTMLEVGSDVVVSGGGTIDTDGLTYVTSGGGGTAINGSLGIVRVSAGAIDFYSSPTGPALFGLGGIQAATSSSGDVFGVQGFDSTIQVPNGYVSGAPLSATETFAGATFASLGVLPGTYVWAWGKGADFDTFTLLIGADAVAAATVPAPASALLLGVGVVAAAVGRSRRLA